MSSPLKINTSWVQSAEAEELPKKTKPRIEVELQSPDMGAAESAGEVHAVVGPSPPPENANQATIGLLPLWAVAVLWVVAIILFTQGIKAALKALKLKERIGRLQFKRWMFVAPIGVGMTQGYFGGPIVTAAFGFEFSPLAAMFLIGFTSGAAAPWVYMFFRHVILPVLPSAIIALVEKVTQITLPDEVKDKVTDSGLFNSPSEVSEEQEME